MHPPPKGGGFVARDASSVRPFVLLPHFVSTVGGAPLEVIKKYVANQRNV
jgi:hypothetical protein